MQLMHQNTGLRELPEVGILTYTSHTHTHTPCIPVLLSHIVEYIRLVESIEVRMSRQCVCSHLFKVQPVTHVELREQGITNLVCTVTGWTPQTGEEQRSGLVLCKKRRRSTIRVSSRGGGAGALALHERYAIPRDFRYCLCISVWGITNK